MKSIAKAPMASSETLNSTKSRPNSAPEVAISEETEIEMPIIFPDKSMIEADRPVSASLKDDQPLLPLKTVSLYLTPLLKKVVCTTLV